MHYPSSLLYLIAVLEVVWLANSLAYQSVYVCHRIVDLDAPANEDYLIEMEAKIREIAKKTA